MGYLYRMTKRAPGLLFLLCAAPMMLLAQKDLIWQDYGIGILLPSSMHSVRQDEKIFTARGDSILLQIQPSDLESFVPDDGKDALAGYARDLGYRDIQHGQEIPSPDLLIFSIEALDAVESPVICFLVQHQVSGQVFFGTIHCDPAQRPEAMTVIQSLYTYD